MHLYGVFIWMVKRLTEELVLCKHAVSSIYTVVSDLPICNCNQTSIAYKTDQILSFLTSSSCLKPAVLVILEWLHMHSCSLARLGMPRWLHVMHEFNMVHLLVWSRIELLLSAHIWMLYLLVLNTILLVKLLIWTPVFHLIPAFAFSYFSMFVALLDFRNNEAQSKAAE